MFLKHLVFAAGLSLPSMLMAEEVQVGDTVVVTQASGPATTGPSDVGGHSGGLPAKGMTKRSVTRDFGNPVRKHRPVGGGSPQQPPITRWDYNGFSVFFEHSHVVDAVLIGRPAPIAVYDGLAGGPQ